MALSALGTGGLTTRRVAGGSLARSARTGAALAIMATSGAAHAGSFGLREQSTIGLGSSFAGAAAGSAGLGSMYWNPAVLTALPGINSEWSLHGLSPYASITGDASSTAAYRGVKSGDFANDAVLMSSYSSYQINDRLWLGLATGTPFGLSTKPDQDFTGRAYNHSTKVTSFEIAPSLGWRLNDWLSVGGGVRAVYFKARYTTAFPFPGRSIAGDPVIGLDGDSWGVGYSLGATVTPLPGTEIGIGFRSAVKQRLDGNFFGGRQIVALNPAAVLADGPFKANAMLPEMLTLGVRQKVTDGLTLSGGIEWTNWSRLRYPRVESGTTGLNVLRPTLPLDYKDGWFFSVGGEYRIDPAWTVRAGLGYEISPVKDISRSIRLPDNDRVWTSLGASYSWSDKLSFDVGYAHVFSTATKVRIQPGNPNYSPTYAVLPGGYANLNGKIDSHVDILSIGLRYRWDDPAKPVPASLPLVRKG